MKCASVILWTRQISQNTINLKISLEGQGFEGRVMREGMIR
jgi:hypothetical protein